MRFIICISTLALISGCKTMEERTLPPVVTATPLPLDPTDEYALSHWWTNGTHLLRLDDDAHYALYEGMNRYHPPIERGRWSQHSYAVLWLEPYNPLKPERKRVRITKMDGKIALEVANLEPMVGIEHPPRVLEDDLIGQWEGPMGSLRLTRSLRYTLSPAGGTPTIAGHNGSWRVQERTLLLQPDVAGSEPIRIPIAVVEEKVTLEGPGGRLTSDRRMNRAE